MPTSLFPLNCATLGPTDTRPKRGEWAPGDYFGKCHTCDNTFIGDKHAWSCAPCAYKVLYQPELFDLDEMVSIQNKEEN